MSRLRSRSLMKAIWPLALIAVIVTPAVNDLVLSATAVAVMPSPLGGTVAGAV